jgi:hypothetical protein
VTYRFLGRFHAPDGTPVVYLESGGQEVQAKVGQTLEGGYRVQSISDRAVVLQRSDEEKTLIPMPQEAP